MSNEIDKTVAADLNDGGSNPGAETEGLGPTEWTASQVEEWRAQAAKAQENWERLVRISADFDNYKKRAARERQDATRYANESLLEKLVPILDNLDMALAATNRPTSNNADALKTGVSMIQTQLRSLLNDAGLEEIQATGQPFDPNWHEAVSQQESDDVPEGRVLQQIRRGFKLKDRLIRPASVIVAKRPAA